MKHRQGIDPLKNPAPPADIPEVQNNSDNSQQFITEKMASFRPQTAYSGGHHEFRRNGEKLDPSQYQEDMSHVKGPRGTAAHSARPA